MPMNEAVVMDASERQRLVDVLSRHWVMSLATLGTDGPYSAPVFYAVADAGEKLLFLSDPESRHMKNLLAAPDCAASVHLETRAVDEIEGVQLRGTVACPSDEEEKRLKAVYYSTHPVARVYTAANRSVKLFAFRVRWAKLTNNKLGFGKHYIWEF